MLPMLVLPVFLKIQGDSYADCPTSIKMVLPAQVIARETAKMSIYHHLHHLLECLRSISLLLYDFTCGCVHPCYNSLEARYRVHPPLNSEPAMANITCHLYFLPVMCSVIGFCLSFILEIGPRTSVKQWL